MTDSKNIFIAHNTILYLSFLFLNKFINKYLWIWTNKLILTLIFIYLLKYPQRDHMTYYTNVTSLGYMI